LQASYEQITRAGAVVVTIAPGPVDAVLSASRELKLPFPCLADPDRAVFSRYAVGSSAWSLGQRPAVFLIGPCGELEQAWKGRQQWEIPSIDEILEALRRAGTEDEPHEGAVPGSECGLGG
jgi:peroxiredoxin